MPQMLVQKMLLVVLILSIRSNVERAFASARKLAGIGNLRLLELPQVGRILGHTQPRTTYRYVNADATVRARAAEILHDMQQVAVDEPDHGPHSVN